MNDGCASWIGTMAVFEASSPRAGGRVMACRAPTVTGLRLVARILRSSVVDGFRGRGGLTNARAIRSVPWRAAFVRLTGVGNFFEEARRVRPVIALRHAVQDTAGDRSRVPFRGRAGGRADRADDRSYFWDCAESFRF